MELQCGSHFRGDARRPRTSSRRRLASRVFSAEADRRNNRSAARRPGKAVNPGELIVATTTTKTFDAVEMSRRLREETSRKLATLTREQRLALLNAHLDPHPARRRRCASCGKTRRRHEGFRQCWQPTDLTPKSPRMRSKLVPAEPAPHPCRSAADVEHGMDPHDAFFDAIVEGVIKIGSKIRPGGTMEISRW